MILGGLCCSCRASLALETRTLSPLPLPLLSVLTVGGEGEAETAGKTGVAVVFLPVVLLTLVINAGNEAAAALLRGLEPLGGIRREEERIREESLGMSACSRICRKKNRRAEGVERAKNISQKGG